MNGGTPWKAGRVEKGWHDFSASLNPLGAPARVLDAVRASLEEGVLHYPEPGARSLRDEQTRRLYSFLTNWSITFSNSLSFI